MPPLDRNIISGVGNILLIAMCFAGPEFFMSMGHCGQSTINPNATPAAKSLLDWLSSLVDRNEKRVVSGQFICPHYGRPEQGLQSVDECWEYHYQSVSEKTGKNIALIGFDFCDRQYKGGVEADNMPEDQNFRKYVVLHHKGNGLVRLMWHSPNPFTREDAWSHLPPGKALKDVITPGTPENKLWMTWLDEIASRLQYYQQQDIPIIWGPFHEMNGRWFWWGEGADEDFVLLYRHMYDYFTFGKKLNNLLWLWCPDHGASTPRAMRQYPGNSYVDIIGADRYSSKQLKNSGWYKEFSQEKYRKVLMWGECGKPTGNSDPWDTMIILNEIRESFPKICMYMFWMKTQPDKSIIGNLNGDKLINHPWTINREEIPRFAASR